MPSTWMKKAAVLLAACLVVLSLASWAGAQTAGSGAIIGTVKDPGGLVVPGAEVILKNVDTGAERRFTTTEAGLYAAPYLQPGRYEVRVKKEGFAEVIRQNLRVEVGQTVTVDVELPIRAAQETVTVTSEVGLVETDKTEVSQTISQDQVENLPLNGRRWDNLALLSPGVSEDGGFGGISFRGVSSLYNNNMVDGADNNQAFFSEARGRTRIAYGYSINSIKEFQVQTAVYSAEYGRAAGGVVNAVTKSGTNDWHGDFFYFVRDKLFLARDPVANASGQPKPDERRQQFGGAFGGPLVREKLFFYLNYDQQKRSFPAIITPFAANFFDPNSTNSQARNCITQATANPALGITATDCMNVLDTLRPIMSTTIPRKGDQYLGLGKIDYQWDANNRLSGSFNILRWNSLNGIFTGPVLTITEQNNGTDKVDNEYMIVTWSGVWRPTLVNEARFQYGRDFEAQIPNASGPNLQITGGANFGMPNFLPRGRFPDEKRFQWTDNVSWLKGRHQIRFGVDINHVRDRIQNLFQGGGIYRYSGTQTLTIGSTTVANVDALTRFVRDLRVAGARSYNDFLQSVDPVTENGLGFFTTNDYNFYFQDNIKLRPNLTFNVGIRYELQDLPSTVQSNPLIPENATLNTDSNNFGPRVGFSWQPGRNEKNVLRGGYGLYYGRTQNSTLFAHLFQNGVFQRNFTFTPTSCGAPTLPNIVFPQPNTAPAFTPIFGSTGPTPTNLFADFAAFSAACAGGTPPIAATLASDYVNPLVHQYDIAYERELPWKMSVAVNYVGSRGNHLPIFMDGNLPAPSATRSYLVFDGAGQLLAPQVVQVPFYCVASTVAPCFLSGSSGPSSGLAVPRPRAAQGVTGPIYMGRSIVNSWYNGMVIRVRRRESRGFSFDANYTLSKARDNGHVAGVNGTFGQSVAPLNPFDLRGEYGTSEIDVRNRFIMNIYWVTPFGNWTDNRFLKGILGGWKAASVWRIQDGRPITAGVSTRPTCTTGLGGLTCGAAGNNAAPINSRVPFIERNTQFTSPALISFDLRVAREFKLTERVEVEFLAEGFNIFNRTQAVPASGIFGVQDTAFTLVSARTSGSAATIFGTSATCPNIGATSGLPTGITSLPPDYIGCLVRRAPPHVAPADAFGAIRSTGNTLYGARQLQFGAKVRF